MVYSAFLPIRLLNDYPYPLECLTCYENFLLVGTKQGLLLVYELTPKITTHHEFFIPNLSCLSPQLKEIPFINYETSSSASPPPSPSANLPSFFTHVKTTRTLGKKPITQLAAISEFNILLALAEGRMSVYQLPNCQLITSVRNSKGASLFAYCMEYSKTPTGQVDSTRLEDVSQSLSLDSNSSNISITSETKASQSSETTNLELRICVVVKRHLYFWRWEPKSREFILPGGSNDSITASWPSELTLPEVVRSITFCGLSKLIVGHRGEYLLINIINGELQFISTPGKNQLPIVTSLPHCLHMSSTHLDETHTTNHKSWLSHKNNAHNYYFNTTLRGNPSSFINPDVSLETSGIMNKSDNANDNNNCMHHKYSYYQPLLPGAQTFLGIEQDDSLVVVSPYHELKSVYQMKWSSAPYQIHVYPPYIIGTMNDMLEIRVLYPNKKMIQQLPIPRVTAMCHSGGWFYASTAPASVNRSASPASPAAATTNDHSSPRQSTKESSAVRSKAHPTTSSSSGNEIWLILSANRLKFIQDLVKQKEYELAICLAKTGLYAGQNAVETLQITNLYAIHLYHEMKFTEALNLFTELLINPKHVLTLFPGILSEQQLQQQQQGQIADYPCEISIINSAQMTDAFEPLITYLLTWRRLLKQQLNKTPLKQSKLLNNIREAKAEEAAVEAEDSSQLSLSSRSGQQHQAKAYNNNNNNVVEFHCYSIKDVSKMILPCIELLELIDTSLLKCYLSTNTARVAPLLRQENVCMLEESVKTLLEHKRYQELVMLYQSRGLHREALSILQQFSTARTKHHRTGGGGLMVTTTTTDASLPQNMITLDDKLHKSGLIQQLGHPKRILHYFLQYLNASHIDLLIDYTKWLMLHYPTSWMRILSNWEAKLTAKYQSQFASNTVSSSSSSSIDAVKRDEFIAFCSNYRNQILQYMEQYAPHLIIPYLELIIFVHWNTRHSSGDDDEDEDDEEEVEAEEEEVDDEDDDVEEDEAEVEEDEKIGNNDGVGDSSRDDDSNERLEPGDNSCIMNSTDDSIENKINNGDTASADAVELLHKQKSKPISIVQQPEHHVPVGKHNVSKKIIEHASNKSSPANNILGCRVASLSQLSCNSMDSTQSGYMSPGKRSTVFKEMISSSLWPLPCVKRSKQRRLTTSTMNSVSKVDNSTVNTNDLDALPSIPNYPAYMDVCDIHTRYAIALIRRAQSLQPTNKSFAFKVNEEQPKSGSVARLRLRLLRFLMHPGTQYSSARLLDKCPYDAFFEERALLLANLNKHEQALSLWVHVLDDWNRAVNHCINVYQRSELSSICKNNQNNNNNDNDTKRGGGGGGDTVNTDYPNNSHSSSHHGAINSSDKHSNSSSSLNRHNSLNSLDNSSLLDLNNNNNSNTNHETLNTDNHHPFYDYCNNSNIFFLLIQICLQPTEPTSLGIVLPSSVKFTPKLNKALEILHQFSSFIDPVKVIRIMPTVTLNSVGDYLKSMFISQQSTLTQLVFLQNASKAELIASCTDRIKSTSDHLSILPSTRCRTCRRRIGNSAFVKQPRNANHSELEHYGCCKDLIFKNT